MATEPEPRQHAVIAPPHKMSKTRRGRLGVMIAGALAFTAAAVPVVLMSIPENATSSTAIDPPENVGIDPPFGESVPLDLEFLDETGGVVRLGELVRDKPVILSLVYYECPMLCNLSMDGLVRSLRALRETAGKEFTVVNVSFDPREGPHLAAAAKRTAVTRYGRQEAAHGWHFLTHPGDSARQLAEAVGFGYEYDEASAQYVHAAGLFVLSPQGKISRFLGGVEFAPRDVQLALSEARDGKSRSLADEILLLCFHYDPMEGKYGLAIFRLLRMAGVATVLVLGVSIYRLSRFQPSGNTPRNQDARNQEEGAANGW